MNIEKKIRCYILENFLFTDDESVLNNDASFLGAGLIDSTGILEIILFIEETFDLKVFDEEMLPDNLDSVDKLVAFVKRKQAAMAAAA
ncbi:MAG TPA: acyl carrier protein [Candidatus Competibacteraceae bacterium]|nr:acyl carrier protein [Candidatus Competibacteraceae bacterium]